MTLPDMLAQHGIEPSTDRTDAWPKQPDLFTQTEARQLAAKLNTEWDVDGTGLANVAHAVPRGSWGGQEQGWYVSLASVKQ